MAQDYERTIAEVHDSVLEVSRDEVASSLSETGYQWSQSQDDPDLWQAVASDPRGYRCELTAKIVPGGMEIHGALPTWETDLSEMSQKAVARFLIAANDQVRLVRFTLQNRNVLARSLAADDRLEMELPDSIFAVVTACRLVQREVEALTNDQVAQAYLTKIE